MFINFWAILVAAIVTMPIGFIWYHPKIFGAAWMKSIGADDSKLKEGMNMGLIFGLSLLFALLISYSLAFVVIHQYGIASLLADQDQAWFTGAKIELSVNGKIQDYTNNYRTFRHGVFHGVQLGLLFVTPVLGTNALFERRGFRYIVINGGYWIISLGIMGGIICAWQ